ncbi:sigma-54 dependent transcriptional regulator [Bremerella sp. JC817]|uniref:sigma-54 interaction domain-containing protein n=1 Tax=Bremerella sp. JC817 TaxID=3231756 RepID=UPI00345773A4
MSKLSHILLEVWQQACRHIEIGEYVETIAQMLEQELPLAQLIVRRLDFEHASISTVAAAPQEGGQPLSEHRRTFTRPEMTKLKAWLRRGEIVQLHQKTTSPIALVTPEYLTGDVIAIPLAGDHPSSGVLLLAASDAQKFSAKQMQVAEAIQEPFSVALENDRRLHEMAALREAAEAERGALLRRLGRQNLDDKVVGEETGLRLVMERVALVADSDVPVLILGETGTGKEVVARSLHVRGDRHDGPFIRVNCGAIPSELIDSQLFGHEKGSFTGADQSRQGWFERADGGTLFLDEIGELPLEAQVRFLRVLQDGFVERVGGNTPIHVNVRVVAATHRDLANMVREGKFREDLWYRLAVFPLLLPPLRERVDDIEELANHFADRAALRFGLAPALPDQESLELLRAYDWPGNIRELAAVIDRAAILGDGQRLEVAKALGWSGDRTLQVSTAPNPSPASLAPAWSPPASRSPHKASEIPSLDEVMKQHIESVLRFTEGQIEGRRGAAAILKINPHTLRARMRKLQLDWSLFRPQD